MHDGVTLSNEPVEQRGLAYIGAAYERDDRIWQCLRLVSTNWREGRARGGREEIIEAGDQSCRGVSAAVEVGKAVGVALSVGVAVAVAVGEGVGVG